MNFQFKRPKKSQGNQFGENGKSCVAPKIFHLKYIKSGFIIKKKFLLMGILTSRHHHFIILLSSALVFIKILNGKKFKLQS